MNRFNVLLREPAMLLDFAETLLVLLIAFGVPLNHDNETYIVAVLVAVIGLLKGFSTRPFPVHLVTDLGRAALMLAASFGLNLPPDKVAIIVTFLGTLTTLVGTIRTTPVYDAITRPGGAGAGPVTNESGYADPLVLIGVVLAVLGLLLILLWGHLILGIVVLVVGVVIAFAGPHYHHRNYS